jgi:hypothetical protein
MIRLKLLKENTLISNFIKNWQKSNKCKELKTHNAKFKKEFNEFLNKNKFCKTTIQIFEI